MTIHPHYVGCDVSKASLDIYDADAERLVRIANTPVGITRWLDSLDGRAVFVVLEATGIYDRALRYALAEADIPFARLNPMRAKRFAEASGRLAKTDALDARMLAEYGQRFAPPACPAPDPARDELAALARRRDQLVAMRAQEATRAKDTACAVAARCHADLIGFLTKRIAKIEALIEKTIREDAALAEDRILLRSAPGVGPVTETTILCLMPELGRLTPKTAAALAGLAPYDHSSGLLRGHRKIAGGRARVRRALFMAALSASRCSARYKAAYNDLRTRGKAHKTALVAIARRLLCALNAMLRDRKPYAT